MESWKKNLFWIWMSVFLAHAGFNFSYPVISFYFLDVFRMNPAECSFYTGAFSLAGNLGFFLSSPFWGRLSDLFGRRIMMVRANAVGTLLLPLIPFLSSPDLIIGTRFAIGLFAGVTIAAVTLLSSTTPEEHRGKAIGSISSSVFAGQLFGVVGGGFTAANFGFTANFMLSTAFMLVSTLVPLFLVTEPRVAPPAGATIFPRKFKLPKFGNVWMIMLLMVATGCVQQMDGAYLPLLVHSVLGGGDIASAMRWNSVLGGCCTAVGIFGGIIIGSLCDRFRCSSVTAAVAICAAGCTLPQAFVTWLPALFIERMAMTFFVSGFSPVVQVYLAQAAPPEKRGSYLGCGASFRSLGWLIAGGAALFCSTQFGVRSVFLAVTAAMLLMALTAALSANIVPLVQRKKKEGRA